MVDKAVSSSYEYLVGKLGAVFPQLRAGSFSLTWTDGDGDKVGGDLLLLCLSNIFVKPRPQTPKPKPKNPKRGLGLTLKSYGPKESEW